jgi:hypothetical protein
VAFRPARHSPKCLDFKQECYDLNGLSRIYTAPGRRSSWAELEQDSDLPASCVDPGNPKDFVNHDLPLLRLRATAGGRADEVSSQGGPDRHRGREQRSQPSPLL